MALMPKDTEQVQPEIAAKQQNIDEYKAATSKLPATGTPGERTMTAPSPPTAYLRRRVTERDRARNESTPIQ